MTPEGISVSPSQFEVTNVPTEQSSPPEYRYTVDDLPKPPLLNRAQRRSLRRYIRHKAALQARHIRTKKIYYAPWARQEDRCCQCGLWALGPAPHRCQCKVAKHRVDVVS